ncbi:bifunctional farnesyl-diphosphate farnesyltransferase/squalene synthase [Coemansia sp. RSA 989]|nr:farnesyl-diphosphate farnesyltransferase [Coemansia mojavensis]KAJ1741106.1 bifunctional farnesyl-diphosphate farnesyltransferase/squalene synthase [Coemansia sp. RSA 1086]KAJ1753732.1 bifunctional farnesyl-diphosphate farnesyltransferase/squalene synthase [Coemansia sp. RSA 1821]KAJ1863455.1 bifunctional farnesyl-diphosphate farnesyltransferase/squalene synthase [Coemansia sp. RSA 989]KAJ1871368.1 bifunctional farnesyl-diphosphate farnesyltransferase/squalene synthase [Coemansia sp. RSA 990
MAFLDWVLHPTELWAAFWYFMRHAPPDEKTVKLQVSGDMKRCYDFLEMTSRSFAAVIQELNPKLRDGICLFYLILRGLDTIEDDMTIPGAKKRHLLEKFHETIYQTGWTFKESGPDEKDALLLVEFDVVVNEFLRLPTEYQEVIADITRRMGTGMAKYTRTRVESMESYNEYCHYVAGLVGHGLSRLFAVSTLEDASVGENLELANSMGLFLQKTNITRDINEDVLDGRCFWPKEIWGKYAATEEELISKANREKGIKALNEMCTNALQHIPDVMEYLSQIKEPSVFRFCAIPQTMAIATIVLCYDNARVLDDNVKIRKGEAIKLISQSDNIDSVKRLFYGYLNTLEKKNHPDNPMYAEVSKIIDKTKKDIATTLKGGAPNDFTVEYLVLVLFFFALAAFFYLYPVF